MLVGDQHNQEETDMKNCMKMFVVAGGILVALFGGSAGAETVRLAQHEALPVASESLPVPDCQGSICPPRTRGDC